IMTSAQFVFFLTYLLLGTPGGLVSAHICDGVSGFCWYKQTFREKPKLISCVHKYGSKITFYDEFKNSPRFLPDIKQQTHYLTILDLTYSDSATYYCAVNYEKHLSFLEATTVSVTGSGSNIQALVHQSASETVQPGGSVTLNCTVQTGSCDGEHSVYWFRNSEDSHPGLIYTHGGRNDQCERNSNTQTHTCVSKLSLKNLNVSHAGTYYCVIASCGHIAFLVHFFSGSLTTLLVVLLIFLVYEIKKRSHYQTTGMCTIFARLHIVICFFMFCFQGNNQNTNSLYYACIDIKENNRSKRRRESTKTVCVYSSINQEI
uniref:Ig-like domain-containing protein n=1 Tax=Kryptolebias marmoratus TaxID=37003 RepID=A0A3Q3GIQ4_KRYMA